jgi:hypothetical protein
MNDLGLAEKLFNSDVILDTSEPSNPLDVGIEKPII